MICNSCGAPNPDGAERCASCGQPLVQAQAAYGAPVGGAGAPFQKREIVMAIILSVITCGIYGIYWFVKLTDESNMIAETPTASGVMALVLTIVTCGIYGIYWAYKKGETIDKFNASRGMAATNNAIIYLVLELVFPIAIYILLQNELNKIAQGQ